MTPKRDIGKDVLKTLNDFGRLPTSKISAIVGVRFTKMERILNQLEKEGKVKKTSETIATYWEVNKDGET